MDGQQEIHLLLMDKLFKDNIKSLIMELFELLSPSEKQKVLNRLNGYIEANHSQVSKRATRKELITEMALQINRATITK